ncbi:MAG TPA: hypothetical protein DCW68_05300 [Rhodospirillaceae bacterium]|nr:MAG: hypothetical protein A2018_02350 [Alphaproteobacteria bacterium GWF2_58_20]HAU29511.1 hypothetical protein [Rhodospirillaceae bacterium]
MTAYTVTVRTQGKLKTFEINASSPMLAEKQGRRFGTVLKVSKGGRSIGGRGLSVSDRYIFLVRLSTMLASKVGTTEALRLLRDSFTGKISQAAAALLEKVELGMDLPNAIAEDHHDFPGAIGLIIKVGAQSGQTWRSLRDAAEFEHKISEVRRTSNKGMVAAILSFFVAGALLVVSNTYIGPEIQKMTLIDSAKESLNLGWINSLSWWSGILMGIVLVVFFSLIFLATVGRRVFPSFAERIILKVPFYREIVMSQDNYINLHRLSLLARSGVRMEDALRSTFESCRPGVLKDDIGHSLDALRRGQKWASGMTMLHPTDRAALMLAADREQIAVNLENIGDQYQSLYMQRLAVFAPTLQVIAAIAVSVSGIVLFGVSVLPMLQVSAGLMSN